MTIESLEKKILQCQLCPLATTRTHAVPGDGNIRAEVLFIGEGPGEKEDKQGKPFCGASGKFLDELLVSINLSRESVFITNVVKCRPPQNRDPEESEIEICSSHYLYNQIEMINPKIICFLGRHAMGLFMKNMKISQVHGKVFRKQNRFLIALYHPAVALYNGSMRKVLLDDFQILNKIINGKYTYNIVPEMI